MTNEEIDKRLRGVADVLPVRAEQLSSMYRVAGRVPAEDRIARELELLNMSMMAIFIMLGEIAKRLPEPLP